MNQNPNTIMVKTDIFLPSKIAENELYNICWTTFETLECQINLKFKTYDFIEILYTYIIV